MKKYAIFIWVGILSLLLAACGKENETETIRITSETWSGWFEDYTPEINERTYTVTVGDTIDLSELVSWGSLTIRIREISDEGITIVTNESMSEPDEQGRISLGTDKKEFVIEKNRKLELQTPTTDEGVLFCFEWIEQKEGS